MLHLLAEAATQPAPSEPWERVALAVVAAALAAWIAWVHKGNRENKERLNRQGGAINDVRGQAYTAALYTNPPPPPQVPPPATLPTHSTEV